MMKHSSATVSGERASDPRDLRIPVLMYHRIGPSANAWELRYGITAERFSQHVDALAEAGYTAISVQNLFAWLDGRVELAPKSFVLTFDDGFQGLHPHVAPLLAARGWPYTVFLVAGLIGGEDEWTRHENPAGSCHRLLCAREIAEMAAMGADFQSHSLMHRSLPTLGDEALEEDLRISRERLQDLLDAPVDFIAYPFGHTDTRVQAAARAVGYRGGFSTQPGFNRQSVDRFGIRRLDISGGDTCGALLRKLRFGSNDGRWHQPIRYYVSRLLG